MYLYKKLFFTLNDNLIFLFSYFFESREITRSRLKNTFTCLFVYTQISIVS